MKRELETGKTMRLQAKDALKEYRFLIKPTIIFSAIYLIGISAILRANFYYDDDIARALRGYTGWGFSRYLTIFLSQIVHADSYLTDISPLPQIMAAFIMALASTIAVYLITGKKNPTFWYFISAIPIGLSPYFLECFSFKYDSPYMALSVLFTVAPLLFCDKNQIVYLLCTICGMIGMCTTYQASSGIFPMLVIVMGICWWVNGEKTEKILKFFAVSAAGYVLGLLLFRKVIMSEYIDYASTTAVSSSNVLSCTLSNYKKYIINFLIDFKPEWLAIIFLICACFWWTAISESKKSKLLTFVFVPLGILACFLLSFGAYPFLTSALFAPRAMYGIGCFIAFAGIFATSKAAKGYIAKAACLILSWAFFVFSFTYGNALSVQAQYTDFRITEVIGDLAECDMLSSEEDITLQITGTIGYSPVIENMLGDFPIIEKLVPVTFQGDGWWGEYGLRNYYCLPELQFAESYDPPDREMTIFAENYYHTIWVDENYIWIDLH